MRLAPGTHLEFIFVLLGACLVDQPDEGLGQRVQASGRRRVEDVRPGVEEDGDDDVAAAVLDRQHVEQKFAGPDFVT